jgi:hypothetical protein
VDFLLKVGQKKYIDDMYEKEYLFFNSFSSFRTKETDACGRNDPREANIKNKQITYLEITLPNAKTIKLSEISKQFNAQYNEFPTIIPHNICSLYTLHFGDNLSYQKIDDRVLCLGDKTIVIYNLEEFFNILDNSLEKQKLEFSRKPITYYNYKVHNGDLTFHHKDDSYRYQNEYRILIQTSGTEKVKVCLPGLKKISAVVDTIKINTLELKMV